MRRLSLHIEYCGTRYCGWQSQENGTAIQDVVAQSLSLVLGRPTAVYGASRTDSGVHALGQVAHFDTDVPIPTQGVLRSLNDTLPADIRVVAVNEVAADFDSSRDAIEKWYRYLIWPSSVPSAILQDRAWHCFRPLNLQDIMSASQVLVGTHDFTTFSAADTQAKTRERSIYSVEWSEAAVIPGPFGKLLMVDIRGGGFLKQMVRNMVGTLVEVGMGKRSVESVKEILLAKDRRLAGICAPACGLYLMKVSY